LTTDFTDFTDKILAVGNATLIRAIRKSVVKSFGCGFAAWQMAGVPLKFRGENN
jgi:hypothetical protein